MFTIIGKVGTCIEDTIVEGSKTISNVAKTCTNVSEAVLEVSNSLPYAGRLIGKKLTDGMTGEDGQSDLTHYVTKAKALKADTRLNAKQTKAGVNKIYNTYTEQCSKLVAVPISLSDFESKVDS